MAKKPPAYLQQAVKYVEYWAPRLRLDDWAIQVVEAPDNTDSFAQMSGNPSHLKASIAIRDPKKNEIDDISGCNDLEVTVVHELLHVRFAEMVAVLDGREHYPMEQATEMTALALVAARRGVHPRKLAEAK